MSAVHPIKQYRQAKGLSQATLADALGVSRLTVVRWETGARSVQKALLSKVQKVTGVDPAKILRFELDRA